MTFALLCCYFSLAVQGEEASYDFEVSDNENPAVLSISLAKGSITVIGHRSNEINIKIKENTKGRYETSFNSKRIFVLKRGHLVTVESEDSDRHLDLVVNVPFDTTLILELDKGGDIDIFNVHGVIDANNSTGTINALGVHGPIVAEVFNSNLLVIFEKFNSEKPSSLISHKGNMEVRISQKSQLILAVKNYKGNVYSSFKAEYESVLPDMMSKHNRLAIKDYIVAQLNNGTQKLTMTSFDGDVIIKELLPIIKKALETKKSPFKKQKPVLEEELK